MAKIHVRVWQQRSERRIGRRSTVGATRCGAPVTANDVPTSSVRTGVQRDQVRDWAMANSHDVCADCLPPTDAQ